MAAVMAPKRLSRPEMTPKASPLTSPDVSPEGRRSGQMRATPPSVEKEETAADASPPMVRGRRASTAGAKRRASSGSKSADEARKAVAKREAELKELQANLSDALRAAAGRGDVEAVRELCAHESIDINMGNDEELTALMKTAMCAVRDSHMLLVLASQPRLCVPACHTTRPSSLSQVWPA